MDDLIRAVLEWWNEHKCDSCGDYGEFNVYDDEPEYPMEFKKTLHQLGYKKKQLFKNTIYARKLKKLLKNEKGTRKHL